MRLLAATVCAIGAFGLAACDSTGEESNGEESRSVQVSVEAGWAHAVEPKVISPKVHQGIEWLLGMQMANGAWGQGEESARMGRGMNKIKGLANVADTSMAALALIRSGLTEVDAKVRSSLERALDYICGEVASAPAEGLSITKVTGTRVQGKIGPYVDTFLASLVLNEVRGRTGSDKRDERVLAALDKVMDKIEKNQGADGTWDRRGWAPVLTQGLAGKAVNYAAQSGYAVGADVLVRVESQALVSADIAGRSPASGSASIALGSTGATVPDAGISLYRDAANLSILSQGMASNYGLRQRYRLIMEDEGSDSAAREKAQLGLDRIEKAGEAEQNAREMVIGKIDDPGFISGFGSNGGEEFLSYMQLSESLVVKADDVWKRWDQAVSDNLNRVQNEDGSWTGHHCITGRTFCTSAALLTLMADRVRFPETALAEARKPVETK